MYGYLQVWKKYLPSARKTQVEFRSYFSGEKKCVLWAGKYGTYI